MVVLHEPKGFLRRFFGGTWRALDATRRVLANLLLLGLLVALVAAFVMRGPRALQERTVLVLDLAGPLVEQAPGGARGALLAQLSGEGAASTRLRDVIAVLDTAAKDPKIERALLLLERLSGGGPAAQREVAAAIERFKAAGKQVLAWGTGYDQRQYFIAAHASEVYLHPMGLVQLQGYGGLRTYWRDAFDRLGVVPHVIRAGKFKNAGETFSANAPSPETLEQDAALYGALWTLYTKDVERARGLPEGAVAQGIEGLPGTLVAEGGDVAALMLKSKMVDGLKTRDELRALLIERGAEDKERKTFRQVSFRDYLAHVKPKRGGDAIGVVVAEGVITEGDAPPGQVGGRSTAELIRKARDDEKVKALVLRVNSPGGSALGSELVRRELEVTRAAGKPVVVSMGDVAGSGGYWVSMAADEVIADEATITGSIGVVALLATAEGLMDKLSVRTGGHSTTWLGKAFDPRAGMDPRFAALVESAIGHVYRDFVAKAAAARKTTPEKIDAVAQGRVWSGAQAQGLGLVDRNGTFDAALKAAASRAKLPEDVRVQWIEREPGPLQRIVGFFGAELAATLAGPGDFWSTFAAEGWVPPLAREAQRELRFVIEALQHGRPFEALAHCQCGAP
jgi:protease-4